MHTEWKDQAEAREADPTNELVQTQLVEEFLQDLIREGYVVNGSSDTPKLRRLVDI